MLKMKYLLVTGASTGIGYEITRFFIEKGWFVFGSVRKEADAKRLKEDFGGQFHPLIFDVCEENSIRSTVAEVEKILDGKGLSGLVNNAGLAVYGPLMHLPIEEFEYQMNVNLTGALRVTQAFLPLLGAQKPCPYPAGKIFNISSVSGFVTFPFLGAYAISKHALESLSDALRRELLIYGIDVVSIQPGAIETPIWSKAKSEFKTYPDTDYHPMMKNFDQMIEKTEKNAIPAAIIAKKIYSLINKKKAGTRYIIAKKKLQFILLKYILPHRMIDRVVKKIFKRKGLM